MRQQDMTLLLNTKSHLQLGDFKFDMHIDPEFRRLSMNVQHMKYNTRSFIVTFDKRSTNMTPIIECVPNISEGKDLNVITLISNSIEKFDRTTLLHVDRGESANRTVFTFAGHPDQVVEAAYQLIALTKQHIDMTFHSGIHPRMGATDVCPIIPIQGISMAETVALSHQLAFRVGEELQIPVYMYEKSAINPLRKNLATIRAGEYEGFTTKIYHKSWTPDYGPTKFQPTTGQTVIGARNYLVAYNVNLNTKDVSIAKRIAEEVRESGRIEKKEGQIVRDMEGNPVRIPGKRKYVKAIGWYVPEFQCAQVSTNLVNIQVTPPHIAFETIKETARAYGVSVTGSELVGLIPLVCLTEAGKYYAGNHPLNESDAIALAIQELGLSQLSQFEPSKRIIEYLL